MAKPKPKSKSSPPADGATVTVWEDDPEPAVLVTRPVPDLTATPLAFSFPKPAPSPADDQQGTKSFRFWVAAEALRRGADFWSSRVPSGVWQPGATLPVLLDEGEDLNAFYDRQALNFFHGPGATGTVFSGESPDVLCHEMGHAILDSIKPLLFDAATDEAAAFHEAFGDISAMLSALQLPSLRDAVLSETGGHLYRNSRLSRLAEQLGSAIRAQQPDAVAPDCLRNAVNSFTYQDPLTLPHSAPASSLSSEPHSFSRVFSGAFLEIVAGMLAAKGGDTPDSQTLATVSGQAADILITAILQAPVVPDFFAQVAAGMVQAAAAVDAAYPAILKGVFVRRSILSLQSATTVQALHATSAAPPDGGLVDLSLPADHYGLSQTLLVSAASHARRFVARAAGNDAMPVNPPSSATAARAFVDDLFRRGSVDYGAIGPKSARLGHGGRSASHRLRADGDAVRLERCLFDCGLRH